MPSTPSRLARSQRHLNPRLNGGVRNMQVVRGTCACRSRASCRRSGSRRSSGNVPAGLRGCGNALPAETWKPSTPASSSHLQTWIDSSSVVPLLAPREHGVVVVDGADLELQVEVVADRGADGADDLEREPRAVLERAAVLVRPVVDRGAEELGDQVAVAAVDLDAVEPGLAHAARRLGEGVDDLVDLRPRSSARTRTRGSAPACRSSSAPSRTRCRRCRAGGPRRRSGRCTTQSCSCTLLAELAPERDLVVVVEVRVVGDDAARADARASSRR